VHVYRWDLDKTYLATEIGSVRGLLRAAMEKASEKRNVPGAADLLRGLIQWDPACQVAIVSGSPTQMRAVLEEKLALDGVRFDSLILKDNLNNLKRGRLRAVRGQLGYKLPQLLRQRIGLGHGVHETLFGDDVEVDALIYAVYADAIAGKLDGHEVARIMEAGGAYEDVIADAVDALGRVGRADAVEDIFIVLDKGTPVRRFELLGSRVIPVFSWLQAAVILWARRRLGVGGVVDVARACVDESRLGEPALGGLFQDLVRRGHVGLDQVHALLDEAVALAPARPVIERALTRLGPAAEPRPRSAAEYMAFLRASH
jgi:hypothetical protein